MKKIEINTTEDIEKLYQGFKKKLMKDFDNGVTSKGEGKKMSEWIQKKTGLSELMSVKYAQEFLEQILKEAD